MATKKEQLVEAQKAIENFINLSKYLFGENAPYDINETQPDNPFYETAKAISDEMGLNWKAMTHDDSNRVMLNILSEYFCNINVDEKYKPILTVSFKAE